MQMQSFEKDNKLFLRYFGSRRISQMIRYFRKASDKMQFFVRNLYFPQGLSKIQLTFKQNNLCFDFTEQINILYEAQQKHLQVDLTTAHWKKYGTPTQIKYKIQQEAFQIYSFPQALFQTCIACRKDEQSRIDFLWIEKEEEDEYEAIYQKDTIKLGYFLFDTKFIRSNHQLHKFLVSTPSRYSLFRKIGAGLYLSHLNDQQQYEFDLTRQKIIIKSFYQDLVIQNLPISHQFQVIQLRLPVFQNLKTLTIESNRIEIVQFLQQKCSHSIIIKFQNLNASFLRSLRKVLNENVYFKFFDTSYPQEKSIVKGLCEMKYLTQIHKMKNTQINMNKLMIDKQQLIKIPTLIEKHLPQIVSKQNLLQKELELEK